MVLSEGHDPPTSPFEAEYSIQLSYESNMLERTTRNARASLAWKAGAHLFIPRPLKLVLSSALPRCLGFRELCPVQAFAREETMGRSHE